MYKLNYSQVKIEPEILNITNNLFCSTKIARPTTLNKILGSS